MSAVVGTQETCDWQMQCGRMKTLARQLVLDRTKSLVRTLQFLEVPFTSQFRCRKTRFQRRQMQPATKLVYNHADMQLRVELRKVGSGNTRVDKCACIIRCWWDTKISAWNYHLGVCKFLLTIIKILFDQKNSSSNVMQYFIHLHYWI
jgi:hypothetical protein